MNIKILFEDKNLFVINKPAGISVHGDGKTNRVTLADWILEKYPKLKKVGEPFFVETKGGKKIQIYRPGIVHRLDRETSGVLLVAKDQKTFIFLKEQFQNHKIKKVYNAFVYGLVSDPKASLLTSKRGVVDVPIGRSPKDIRMWTAGRGAKEPLREARTEYLILKSFKEKGENFSYLEVYPKTGRTHQIRVHLRYINHPIVSDPLYRGTKKEALGMKRLSLHAKSLTFELPNGEIKTIEAPYPTDFKKIIDKYMK
jgi:23S rRNA pseudouridine1911/1915/1917 synthase